MVLPPGARSVNPDKEPYEEISAIEQDKGNECTKEIQQNSAKTNMDSVLETNTQQQNSTMVEANSLHTQASLFKTNTAGRTNDTNHLQKKREPPDPRDQKNGEGGNAASRGPDIRGGLTSTAEQCGGTATKTRERSHSPSRFRLVDRATTPDNRTKLGGQSILSIPLDRTSLPQINGARPSEDP
ncbi:hypothetical protein ACSBR2_032793 [Camellia fascicularis]